MSLIDTWLALKHSQGLSNYAALRELNDALGKTYRDNLLYVWRSGAGHPNREVSDYMRSEVLRSVLENRLGVEIHPSTVKAILQDIC